jgi:hypothetical protein
MCGRLHAIDQCRAILTTGLFQDNDSFGRQIFKRDISNIGFTFAKMQSLAWDDQVARLILEDDRKLFFHVRVLAQTYSAADSKFFADSEATFKNIEFLLGRVALYQELDTILIDLKEPELAGIFDLQKQEAADSLKAGLKKIGAIKNPEKAFHKIEKNIDNFDWMSPGKGRKFLIKEMIGFAKNLNEQIKNNKFDKSNFDEGLHRLRRRLRELSFRLFNLDGLILLVDEGPLPPTLEAWYEELKEKNPDISKNLYLPMSAPEVKHPYVAGLKLFSLLTQVVADIGQLKDKDEPLFYIEKVIREQKFDQATRSRALAKLKTMKDQSVDQQKVAVEYQQRILDSGLLDAIIAFLEQHNL